MDEGDALTATIGGTRLRLPLRLLPGLPPGALGVPVGLSGVPAGPLSEWAGVERS